MTAASERPLHAVSRRKQARAGKIDNFKLKVDKGLQLPPCDGSGGGGKQGEQELLWLVRWDF